MAALFGELGANAIHKIAEANGWKDGSPEKIAMHAALAAVNAEIVKGNITAAAVTGGSTEALSNVILKAVGEAKGSSASAQWAAVVVGAALSSVTGGDAQSGANIAANAIKNNHLSDKQLEYYRTHPEDQEALNAVSEQQQLDLYELSKDDKFNDLVQAVRELDPNVKVINYNGKFVVLEGTDPITNDFVMKPVVVKANSEYDIIPQQVINASGYIADEYITAGEKMLNDELRIITNDMAKGHTILLQSIDLGVSVFDDYKL